MRVIKQEWRPSRVFKAREHYRNGKPMTDGRFVIGFRMAGWKPLHAYITYSDKPEISKDSCESGL